MCLVGHIECCNATPVPKGLGGQLGRHDCLGERRETVSNMFSPEDRELRLSGICTNRHDLPKPSPEAPDIRCCGTCFARLVGKSTHRGRGYNCPRILPDVKHGLRGV